MGIGNAAGGGVRITEGSMMLFTQAIEMGQMYRDIRKEVLGEDHVRTLTSTSNVTAYYCKFGEYKKAADIGKQCLDMRKAKLGENHSDTLTSMNDLAWYC